MKKIVGWEIMEKDNFNKETFKGKTLKELLNNDRRVSIEKTNKSFEYWINKPYISPNLRKDLKKVNVLFVPTVYRDFKEPCFHADAIGFYNFLEKQKDEKIRQAFCIEDKDYKELHLHSELIRIGEIVVECIILPLFLSYLNEFIYERVHKNNSDFELKINVQKEDENKEIDFKGSVDDFKEVVNNIEKFV